jgi:hypothetical protein
LEFTVTINAEAFKKSLDNEAEKYDAAFKVAANMIASMMKTAVRDDIRSAGGFGDKYLSGLSVEVEDNVITTTLDAPGANIFEDGGTIKGRPLLWLPLSGTDAVGIPASAYGDQLFSVNRKTGGVPLLFSIKDHAPKYFGVPSVEIPKKFHIAETQVKVMEHFPEIFKDALRETDV